MSDTSSRDTAGDTNPHLVNGAANHSDGLNSVDILHDSQSPKYIGDATMDKDGVITLHMRQTADGLQTSANLQYKPSDKHYDEVLCHLGGLKPGEVKLVKPFDEAKEGSSSGLKKESRDCEPPKPSVSRAPKW